MAPDAPGQRARWPQLVMIPGEDVVGIGADLSPATLLAGYRIGVFPMGVGPSGSPPLAWWCPQRRGVLAPNAVRVSRSLAKSAATMQVSADSAFAQVVAGCADPSRQGRWITDEVAAAYTRLHELGHAHSIEVWHDDELVGGLYGVLIGGLFAGESMFHTRRDASKIALAQLAEILTDDGHPDRIIDTQWLTPHLASMGAVEIDRLEYLRRVRAAVALPAPTGFGELSRRRTARLRRHALPDQPDSPDQPGSPG